MCNVSAFAGIAPGVHSRITPRARGPRPECSKYTASIFFARPRIERCTPSPSLSASRSTLRACAEQPQRLASGIASVPEDYNALREEAIVSTKAALANGEMLIELQFPAVANMATAALNQLLDANRSFARDFLRAFTVNYDADRINVVFPDEGEARLAQKNWGDVPFNVRALPKSMKAGRPSYVREIGALGTDGLILIINPGFNISEWICMELFYGADPIILINGDLDKVRGSYYPKVFYPGLHKTKNRFLSRFKETYYWKQFSNGGTLLRRYGGDWSLLYRNADNDETVLLQVFPQRPQFRVVEDLLRARRNADLVDRGQRSRRK
jgi:Domain of unknown function (DUF1995)